MNYKEAAEFIIRRRKTELDAAAALFGDAIAKSPALLKTETALRALILAEAKGEKADRTQKAALEAQKRDILDTLGITDKQLFPPPACKKCGDTAHIKNGYCSCVKSLRLNDADNIEIPVKTFSEVDYRRFDPTHRARNTAVYDDVRRICEKYPDNKRRMIIVMGSTGTGKTLLAGCAVAAFIERGFTACAVTAFGFTNRALKYHTTFDEQKYSFLEPLLDSDLLVIDDLGNENFLKNVTHEYLFNILNERLNAEKITLITSNLSQDGILARYGERIYSRLFNKESSYANILNGADMRKK